MRIVLLGAPGSGKGTQADKISAKYRIPHVSTGDLLREALASGTPLGLQAKAAMDAGQLVSDEIVMGIIRERLRMPDARKGCVLDGFPRNMAQGQTLDLMLRDLNQPLDCAVLLDVDFDLIMQRLAGRRSCENCGATYNVYTNPPRLDEQCDRCGAPLRHRTDDNEVTVNNRLKVYDAQTRPLIEFYRKQGRLETVDGVGEVGEVFRRLLTVLGPIAKGRRKPIPVAPPETPKLRKPARTRVRKSVAAVARPARKKPVSKKRPPGGKPAAGKKSEAVKPRRKKAVSKKSLVKKSARRKKPAVSTKKKRVARKPAAAKASRKATRPKVKSHRTTRTAKANTAKKKRSRK